MIGLGYQDMCFFDSVIKEILREDQSAKDISNKFLSNGMPRRDFWEGGEIPFEEGVAHARKRLNEIGSHICANRHNPDELMYNLYCAEKYFEIFILAECGAIYNDVREIIASSSVSKKLKSCKSTINHLTEVLRLPALSASTRHELQEKLAIYTEVAEQGKISVSRQQEVALAAFLFKYPHTRGLIDDYPIALTNTAPSESYKLAFQQVIYGLVCAHPSIHKKRPKSLEYMLSAKIIQRLHPHTPFKSLTIEQIAKSIKENQ